MALPSAAIDDYDASMAPESAAQDFYGFLGRVQSQPGRIVLRFYPIDSSGDTEAKPVLEVHCHEPQFTASIAEKQIDREFEIEVSVDRFDMHDASAGTSMSLQAANFAAHRVPLDIEDYVHRLKLRDQRASELSRELIAVRRQNEKFKSVAQELLRRAEIKGAGSAELQRQQKSAVDALQRLLVELDTDE